MLPLYIYIYIYIYICSQSKLQEFKDSNRITSGIVQSSPFCHITSSSLIFGNSNFKFTIFFSFAFGESLIHLKSFDFLLRGKIGCRFFVKQHVFLIFVELTQKHN